MAPETNGWSEYQKLVLAELERLGKALEAMNEKMEKATDVQHEALRKLEVRTSLVELRATFWGALVGVAAVLIAIGMKYLGS
jgi:hypothetical protein